MRVYVPLTLSGLAEAYKTGELGAGPLLAYAVTPALREWYLSDDIEELEYAALNRAALASLRLLAADDGAARRRVVVAVDVADGAAVADPDRALDPSALGEVRVAGTVRLAKAAAVHVDSDDAEEDVTAAVNALEAADAGDDDAQFVVDGAEDHELLWYATQEIPNLVGGQAGPPAGPSPVSADGCRPSRRLAGDGDAAGAAHEIHAATGPGGVQGLLRGT